MKKILKATTTILASIILFAACKKSESSNGSVGSGTFTVDGVKYEGTCADSKKSSTGCTTNTDVLISNGTQMFLINNIPTSSSGTTNFTTFATTGCGNFGLYGTITGGGAYTTSGTITKTSSTSFTFQCVCGSPGTSTTFNIVGSGSY